jgi:hypothetical protein
MVATKPFGAARCQGVQYSVVVVSKGLEGRQEAGCATGRGKAQHVVVAQPGSEEGWVDTCYGGLNALQVRLQRRAVGGNALKVRVALHAAIARRQHVRHPNAGDAQVVDGIGELGVKRRPWRAAPHGQVGGYGAGDGRACGREARQAQVTRAVGLGLCEERLHEAAAAHLLKLGSQEVGIRIHLAFAVKAVVAKASRKRVAHGNVAAEISLPGVGPRVIL